MYYQFYTSKVQHYAHRVYLCVVYVTQERDRWGDPDVDGRIMLGWIFKKWDVGVRTGLGWLRIGIHGGRL
jgi:hypothetical protein